jgi:hypothetical protein
MYYETTNRRKNSSCSTTLKIYSALDTKDPDYFKKVHVQVIRNDNEKFICSDLPCEDIPNVINQLQESYKNYLKMNNQLQKKGILEALAKGNNKVNLSEQEERDLAIKGYLDEIIP